MVKGNTAFMKDSFGAFHNIKIKLGNFGEAYSEIVKTTGQKFYNIELTSSFKVDLHELGVISEDGLRITKKSMMREGIDVLEWMTEEEAANMELEGSPIEA